MIEKIPASMRVLGESEGADHPSGADFDQAVFRLVLNDLGGRGRQLEQDDPDSGRLLAKIKHACTQAEGDALYRNGRAGPRVAAGYNTTIRLGRPEFVSLVRPVLRDSIAMATRVLRTAGVQASDLAAMILVGGCCRMPVVAELLQREFKAKIALGTHPEYDVAIGTLLFQQAGKVTVGAHAILATAAVLPDATAAASVDDAQPVESASVEPSPTVAGSAPTEEAKESREVEQLESEQLQTAHPMLISRRPAHRC